MSEVITIEREGKHVNYRKVKRKAEVGELVLITQAGVSNGHHYREGDVFTVAIAWDGDEGVDTTVGYELFNRVYAVLEPLEAAQSQTAQTQADRIEAICNEVRDLLIRKNHDYGDSFSKQFEKYGILSGLIRKDDKMRRLETLISGEQAQVAESIEDTLLDDIGYGILTLVELRKKGGV